MADLLGPSKIQGSLLPHLEEQGLKLHGLLVRIVPSPCFDHGFEVAHDWPCDVCADGLYPHLSNGLVSNSLRRGVD